MNFIVLTIASYLLGSIPFALLIAHAHGKNLRSIGSGNIGATNLSRAVGRKWGIICFVLDVLKGFVPMLAFAFVISRQHDSVTYLKWLSVGVAAILGHIFPVYIGFKGGKGVATSFGVALGLWPYFTVCALIAIVFWIIVAAIWRYVSLASMVAAVVFPICLVIGTITRQDWAFRDIWPLYIVAVAIPLMVVIRHRDNIKRIAAGTESKIFASKKA